MVRIASVAAVFSVLLACEKEENGDGPLLIESYSVVCENDKVTFTATTSGPGFDGLVYTQETASEYQNNGELTQYSDEHDLLSNGNRMTATIDAGGDAVRNESTLFTCDGHYNEVALDGGPFMTFAFAAYGEDGEVTDCLVGGHDPQGLKNGDYSGAAVNAPSFDLGGCVVAQ